MKNLVMPKRDIDKLNEIKELNSRSKDIDKEIEDFKGELSRINYAKRDIKNELLVLERKAQGLGSKKGLSFDKPQKQLETLLSKEESCKKQIKELEQEQNENKAHKRDLRKYSDDIFYIRLKKYALELQEDTILNGTDHTRALSDCFGSIKNMKGAGKQTAMRSGKPTMARLINTI